jgi:uncharacterized protein YdhG (YjbR/CyaY superfamily)
MFVLSNPRKMETSVKFKTVAKYFSTLPTNTKSILEEVRRAIKDAAPQAEEVISYNMPAFKLHGILVYYAAHREYIGLYPTASGIGAFKNEFSGYKWSKGAVQFPIDKPMPIDLISKIVKFRLQEDLEKEKRKAKK